MKVTAQLWLFYFIERPEKRVEMISDVGELERHLLRQKQKKDRKKKKLSRGCRPETAFTTVELGRHRYWM